MFEFGLSVLWDPQTNFRSNSSLSQLFYFEFLICAVSYHHKSLLQVDTRILTIPTIFKKEEKNEAIKDVTTNMCCASLIYSSGGAELIKAVMMK